MKDCFENWWLIVRCSWIGGGIGSIPGISASVVDWLAYGHALKTEKGAHLTFGKGDVRGVIASESSNNAKEGGALVPTVAFGVPGSATMAILLGAFLIHGLVPGPDMLHKNLDITYAMVWSVALANILGAGACYAFSPQFARLATLRYTLILPAVLSIVYIGAFEASRNWGDLFALLLFGVFGWLMKQFKWPRPPLVLGLVLGDSHRALHVHLDRALRLLLAVPPGGGDPAAVHPAGDAADHLAPLLRRQPFFQRLLDQPVPRRTRRPAPWPAAAAATLRPNTSAPPLVMTGNFPAPQGGVRQRLCHRRTRVDHPGGQDGASSPHRDSRAANCPGDNPATSGHRPGIC